MSETPPPPPGGCERGGVSGRRPGGARYRGSGKGGALGDGTPFTCTPLSIITHTHTHTPLTYQLRAPGPLKVIRCVFIVMETLRAAGQKEMSFDSKDPPLCHQTPLVKLLYVKVIFAGHVLGHVMSVTLDPRSSLSVRRLTKLCLFLPPVCVCVCVCVCVLSLCSSSSLHF